MATFDEDLIAQALASSHGTKRTPLPLLNRGDVAQVLKELAVFEKPLDGHLAYHLTKTTAGGAPAL